MQVIRQGYPTRLLNTFEAAPVRLGLGVTLLACSLFALPANAHAQRVFPNSFGGDYAQQAYEQDMKRQQQMQQLQIQNQARLMQQRQIMAARQQEVMAAKVVHREAVKAATTLEKNLTEQAEQSVGVKAAIAAQNAAQTELRKLSAPIISDLKTTPEYKAAEKTAKSARQELSRLDAKKSLTSDEEATRRQLLADIMATTELEQAALDRDPKVKAAREQLEAASQEVTALKKKVKTLVDTDPSLAAARSDVASAQAGIKTAQTQSPATAAALQEATMQAEGKK